MEIVNNPLVCVFDSGIGGLNLLNECVRKLPQVDFTYIADNYRMPYGKLSHENLLAIVEEIFDKINQMNPTAAVVACNTVTAQCIDYLRKKYSFNIIGIQPAVKPAAAMGGKCLVLATELTVKSPALKQLIAAYGRGKTLSFACGDLAKYVEENIYDLSAERIECMLPNIKADSVVLGCTHYSFVKDIIKNYYDCPIFDGIDGTADRLMKILGIFDHNVPRAQKISFKWGNEDKNRRVFSMLLKRWG